MTEYNIPDYYRQYINEFCILSDIEDNNDIAVVLPEVFKTYSLHYRKASVYIWWLSVDYGIRKSRSVLKLLGIVYRSIKHHWNFYTAKEYFIYDWYNLLYDLFNKRCDKTYHLVASYYAKDCIDRLICKDASSTFCIEPISKDYLREYLICPEGTHKSDSVLYNPAKSEPFIALLAEMHPEIKFVPLQKMNHAQLIEAYKDAKVFIDFGPFPGAERMPKEAVLFGCCIITGMHGASAYYGDVRIPDQYKYSDELNHVDEIVERIHYLQNHYNTCIHDFDEYKNMVLKLEDDFLDSLQTIFFV